jgi:anti-sigma factor RsiW
MSPERPIGEEDLHAYVDRALDASRQAEVQAYLERHPEVRARVERYSLRRDALRDVLRPVAEEPIPAQLTLRRLIENRNRFYRLPLLWQSMAAAIVLLVVGAAGGWTMHGVMPAPAAGMTALAQEAADTFRVYADDHTHPVEFHAADRAQLADWVTQRLRHPVAIPDLSEAGYRFMGGRVVPTAHGAAAMFMFDDDHGTRLTMLVRPMTVDREAPMSEHAMGDVRGYAWAGKGIGYSLVGDISADKLHPLANEVRRQAHSV